LEFLTIKVLENSIKKRNVQNLRGKYIAPQLIENTMKQSRFIEQIMVIGDGQKMPAALFSQVLIL
jgi:long-subunit acyl-CoA synthetase (AMP-forming)